MYFVMTCDHLRFWCEFYATDWEAGSNGIVYVGQKYSSQENLFVNAAEE